MAGSSRETEIKLAVDDASRVRRVLRAVGFRVSRGRTFEANTIYDTASLSLRQSGELIRVRTSGGVAVFTYKGKAEGGRHKSREELELQIADAKKFATILERLHYQPVFRYEKYRTEFREPHRAGTVVLDETPIGTFLELEGTPSWIDRTAPRLGFQHSDYITSSYGRLYREWCEHSRRKPADMVF